MLENLKLNSIPNVKAFNLAITDSFGVARATSIFFQNDKDHYGQKLYYGRQKLPCGLFSRDELCEY
jgi:hypothetical protein